MVAGPDAEAAREEFLGLYPVGRLGSPADIGDTAVVLASGASGFMNGEVVVDRGRTSKLPTPAMQRYIVIPGKRYAESRTL